MWPAFFPRREAGQAAPTLPGRSTAGGGLGTDFDCDGGLIAQALRADGFDACEDGTGRGTPIVPTPYTLAIRGRGDSHDLEYRQDGVANAILTPNGGRGGIGVGAIAFSAKDHGADAGELAPTLRAGGFTNSHANGGCMPAVAFANTAGDTDLGYRVEQAPPITGRHGDPGNVMRGMQVRRLTPRECERLQGFPDDTKSITIRVCRNEDERHAIALSAAQSSPAQNQGASRPVVVDVLIDLERQHLQLRSLGRSNWSASFADNPSSSPLSIPLADFAHVVALTASTLVRETPTGAAESLLITRHSSAPWSGSVSVHLCGREIEERVADVGWSIPALSHSMKFITSEAGRSSQRSGAAWKTLCCSVAAAISSCIPDEIRASSSYDLRFTTVSGYTLIPYNGRPAKDGPRYKALGNSMAVPVMAWIGRRIQIVDAIPIDVGQSA